MTFKEWFQENLSEQADDIANHGADAGWPHITYTQDCVELYDKFESEIFEALNEDAEEFGHDNIDQFTATFNRADMLSWPAGRKNLLIWYMCERVARELSTDW